jgi:hypothetical protein
MMGAWYEQKFAIDRGVGRGSMQKNLHWIHLLLNPRPRPSAWKASILSLDHQVLFGVLQLSEEVKMHKLFLKLFHSK